MPVAAIFSPGTLSVEARRSPNITSLPVPAIAYDDLHLWIQTQGNSGYVSPSKKLARIAMASSSSGQILSTPSQHQNQSYSMEFSGPIFRWAISENQGVFGEVRREKLISSTVGYVSDSINFFAFVPGDDRGYLNNNLTDLSPLGDGSSFASLDQLSNDTARIYVMPGRVTYDTQKAALIECQLYNATYDLNFSFNFPNQTVSTKSMRYLNPVNATVGYCTLATGVVMSCDTKTPHPHDHMAYQGMMDAFGRVIVGVETTTSSSNLLSGYNQTFYTSRALTVIN